MNRIAQDSFVAAAVRLVVIVLVAALIAAWPFLVLASLERAIPPSA